MVRTFDTPLITNDQSIDRVLSAGLPVLLIFLKDAPTAALDQALSQLAKEHAGQLLIVKVIVKDSPASTQRYHINQTPALVALKNGTILNSAEDVSIDDLIQHAAYLAGKGPKPVHDRPTAQQASNSLEDKRPKITSDATFEQDVLQSSLPVLVDFWAPWCGPCRMVAPIMEKWAREYAGRFNIAKMNVDENPRTAARYGVQSIPTMLVVKNGKIVDRWAGALPENALKNRVATLLGI
jgi:thioredoxin 1